MSRLKITVEPSYSGASSYKEWFWYVQRIYNNRAVWDQIVKSGFVATKEQGIIEAKNAAKKIKEQDKQREEDQKLRDKERYEEYV